MQNTICDKCTKKSCPNKMTTPWVNDKGEMITVEDCAPKRTLIMVQQLHNAVVGLQKSNEELRNNFAQVKCELHSSKALFTDPNVKGFYIEDRGADGH